MVQSSYRQYCPLCCELFTVNILKFSIALYDELTFEQNLNSYMIYPMQSVLVSCSVYTHLKFQTEKKTTTNALNLKFIEIEKRSAVISSIFLDAIFFLISLLYWMSLASNNFLEVQQHVIQISIRRL